MTTPSGSTTSQERPKQALSGFPMLLVNLVLISAVPLVLGSHAGHPPGGVMGLALLVSALGVLSMFGLFSLQPNEARVLILFGQYCGTVRNSGFHWANPFYARNRGRVANSSTSSKSQWRPEYGAEPAHRRQERHGLHRPAVLVEQTLAAGQ